MSKKATLVLQDGATFEGFVFGADQSTAGEIVFSTGMVGYTESLTDPSYYGQILVCTFPLIGNYGVGKPTDHSFLNPFESNRIQAKALIVSNYSKEYDHWNAEQSLSNWMKSENIPGIYGIDTRTLTKHLREKGTMRAKIIIDEKDVDFYDPNKENLLDSVTIDAPVVYGSGEKTIAILDCGCKTSIATNISDKGFKVKQYPWNYDLSNEKFDGLLISSGPGDPQNCKSAIDQISKVMDRNIPTFGICLGHQLMSIIAGAETFKLKYGHRSQNQPVLLNDGKHCYVTSQNHGFAVDTSKMDKEWKSLFTNLNDKTNEGIIHESGRFFSVQFHPEASPGPYDTTFLFDKFLGMIK